MRTLIDDARLAVRRLRRQPGFAMVAVLTLALGLGANTAIFTLLYGVMLRPLPVQRPSELYRLGDSTACCALTGLQNTYSIFSFPLFRHLQSQLDEFSDIAAFQSNTSRIGIRAEGATSPMSVPAAYVSGNYFRMFGVTPAAGRLLQPADDEPGAPLAMVMSHHAWSEQFGGDPSLVGRSFLVAGTPVTLVGVASREFFGESIRPSPAAIWLPLGQEPVLRGATASLLERPETNWLYAIGRVKPNRRAEVIGGRATQALQAWLSAQTFIPDNARSRVPDQRVVVTPAGGGIRQLATNFGRSLTLLFSMSVLVLLIAAANLANLLLAKADRAQTSVRAALGASSARLVRQSLTEGMVIGVAGCASAWVVSVLATRGILALAFPPGTVVPVGAVPSTVVLLFSMALALVTAGVFSAAPAWMSARANPIDAVRGIARHGADRSFVARRTLVVVQVTLSIVLLAAAGLFARSLSRLQNQPLGFEPERQVVVGIEPPALAGEPARLAAVYAEMRQKLQAIPGVQHASYSLYSPMEGNIWASPVSISGNPANTDRANNVAWNRVGPDYFETVGTPVLRGRGISDGDTPTSQRVAVVNRTFATLFFPAGGAGGDVLRAHVGIGDRGQSTDYQVVGVVEDVKYTGVRRAVQPMIFIPALQVAEYGTAALRQVHARSTLMGAVELRLMGEAAGLEPAIRRTLAEVHPGFVITRFTAMQAQVVENFRSDRLLAALAGSYGVLALLLASLGLYGVTAYGVSRRTHEIGIRMALGADARSIVWTVLRGAVIQTAIGLVIGIPLALAAADWVASLLFQVNARDPLVLAAAAAILLATAVLAAAIPARRAARVDPTRALNGL